MRNSAFNALGTALIVPCNFIALFTLARRLGAESMGLFFTLFAVCAVIHWISDAGTTTVLTRRIARSQDDLRRIVGEAIGVMTIVCLASVAMFTAVSSSWMAAAHGEVAWGVVAAAASSMVGRHALDFASNLFRGLERFEFENLARVTQTASFCAFVWLFVQPSAHSTERALWVFAASNGLAAALIWGCYFWTHGVTSPRLSPTVFRAWYGESISLGAGDVIRMLLMQLDTLLLAAMRPSAVVGLFSVAARPLQPLQLVPRMITSVTFPMMSRAGQLDTQKVSRAFAETTNLLWIASLPICVATAACAGPMLLITVGPEFTDAVWPLRLLIWATVFVFVNAQLRFVLSAMDEQRKYLRLILFALVCKLGLGAVLIHTMGIYGACLANLLGETVLCLTGLRVLYGLGIRGPRLAQLARALPGAVAMAAVLAPLANQNPQSIWPLAAAIPASGALYAGICVMTGALPWESVRRVWDKLIGRPSRAVSVVTSSVSTKGEVPEGV